VKATSESNPGGTVFRTAADPGERRAFTLLEILIALALVAILLAASLPYLLDAFSSTARERVEESIVSKVRETRLRAMESGDPQTLGLSSGGVEGARLPEGWKMEIRGLNDTRFREPREAETWSFSPAGICEPLQLRIDDGNQGTLLSFDALTGQLLHDHE